MAWTWIWERNEPLIGIDQTIRPLAGQMKLCVNGSRSSEINNTTPKGCISETDGRFRKMTGTRLNWWIPHRVTPPPSSSS